MIKNYILLISVLFLSSNLSAQYAVGGNSKHFNSVYWLTWDADNLESTPAGFGSFIRSGNYVWLYSPSIRITATVTGLSSEELAPYDPGDWTGDGLGYLYSGAIDGGDLNAPQGVPASGMANPLSSGGVASFSIALKVEFLMNSVWTEVNYPGMVLADAEDINGEGEYISAETNAPTSWQLMDLQTKSGGNTNRYKLTFSDSGTHIRLEAKGGNSGAQAVMYAHGATALNNVEMRGGGVSALAIGFVFPFDLGDAPESYGDRVSHYIDSFELTNTFNRDGEFSVGNYTVTQLGPKATVFIGEDNVDADGLGTLQTGSDADGANNDQLTGEADEETLDVNEFPLKVNQAGDIEIDIPVTNTKSADATLYMWMDFNGNGFFEAGELAQTNIPGSTNHQSFSLSFPASVFTGKIQAGPLYSRMRITTTALQDDLGTPRDERSVSLAADGEAEDYKFTVEGVEISGTITNDGNGITDDLISGTGMGELSGTPLYAYLIEETSGTAIEYVQVASNGSYAFTDVNPGTYSIGISTEEVTNSFPYTISPQLPNTWHSVGEAFGVNNLAWDTAEPEVRNNTEMRMDIVIPGDGTDISGVDFAVNRAPSASDIVSAGNPASQPVIIEFAGKTSDPEGSVDLTTIQFVDPSGERTSTLEVDGVGAYSLITEAGVTKIKFQPTPGFSGATPLLYYTVKDAAGTESNSSSLIIDIDLPTLIITNPMIYQRVH